MKDFVGYGLEALPFEARETFNALYESAIPVKVYDNLIGTVREFLPLPDSFGVLCVIALGYSDFEPKPLPEESVDRVKWME